jgi:hypothetical protein
VHDNNADVNGDLDDDQAAAADKSAEDRCSPSPALHGASCTDGGQFRGCAAGNAFTFGDTTTLDPISPLMGCIVLYDSRAANAVPVFAVKQPVASDLKSVLSSLVSKFSPIRSKLAICSRCYPLLNYLIEYDRHMYVKEEEFWDL